MRLVDALLLDLLNDNMHMLDHIVADERGRSLKVSGLFRFICLYYMNPKWRPINASYRREKLIVGICVEPAWCAYTIFFVCLKWVTVPCGLSIATWNNLLFPFPDRKKQQCHETVMDFTKVQFENVSVAKSPLELWMLVLRTKRHSFFFSLGRENNI